MGLTSVLRVLDVLDGAGLGLTGFRASRDIVASALRAPRISAGLRAVHELRTIKWWKVRTVLESCVLLLSGQSLK